MSAAIWPGLEYYSDTYQGLSRVTVAALFVILIKLILISGQLYECSVICCLHVFISNSLMCNTSIIMMKIDLYLSFQIFHIILMLVIKHNF